MGARRHPHSHGPGRRDGPGHDDEPGRGPMARNHGPSRVGQRSALRWALGLNGALLVAELVGGFVFGSLALLADGAHMVTDVVGLGIALVALGLAERPATSKHTYGLQRSEVLAAQANGLLLLGATAVIVWEAVRRLGSPHGFDGLPTLLIAVGGLAVNALSAFLLAHQAGRSLNLRAAMLHLAADAATSVGVVIAAIAAMVWGADWPDPVVSLVIAIVVLWTAWGLLRDTTHVLLEGAPRYLDTATVTATLADDPAVSEVHHLHVWDLASDTTALSAHVVLAGELSLHDAQEEADRLTERLADEFGVGHATLQVECHPCEPDAETEPEDSPAS